MLPGQIIFETPSDLKEKYWKALSREVRLPDGKLSGERVSSDFESGHLALRIQPEQYKALYGEWGKLTNGYGFVWYEATPMRSLGFQLEIKDQRAEIRFLLWEIAVRQRGEWGQVNTIWVKDELGFDPIEDYPEGLTKKRGVLSLEPPNGVISNKNKNCTMINGQDSYVISKPDPVRYYTPPYSIKFEIQEQNMIA